MTCHRTPDAPPLECADGVSQRLFPLRASATSSRSVDRPAVHLDQLLGQRQADSQSALAATAIALLTEHLEDRHQRFTVEADPVVDHRNEFVLAPVSFGEGGVRLPQ